MTRRSRHRAPPRHSAPAPLAEQLATVHIDAIAAGGDGVGRVDGLACFIPRTAPGDTVQAALRVRARHATGRVLQLLTPSASRVSPACKHYDGDRCGGCQLQHLDMPSQLAAKASIVRETIRRIGRRDVDLPTVEPSPASWRYRRKLTLTLVRRGHSWVGGLHPHDDASAVFELEECAIADDALLVAWTAVRAASTLLPEAESPGAVLRVMLRLLDDAEGEPQQLAVVVSGGSTWQSAARFAASLPELAALWWERGDGTREEIVPPDDGHRAAASFVQVNRGMAALLFAYVCAQVEAFAPRTVIDAYAGVGQLAMHLARSGTGVTAIEWDRDAIAALETTLPPGSRAIAGAVEVALPGALPADVVVLNPPRSGVDEAVTQALANANVVGVRAIVYVSCDPATLARDLSRLPAWRVASLRCFDMFPQTAHVETVCVLVPEAA